MHGGDMKRLFLAFILIQLQNQACAQELFCEFKVQGAYPFLSTTVPMIDENTLGDEVMVDRFQGVPTTYPLHLMDLSPGEMFKFSIADGTANEVYVTVFEQMGESSGSRVSQISNPEAPAFIKDIPGLCWIQSPTILSL
jgi:hypothetical protein